jgi:hypothetical protein
MLEYIDWLVPLYTLWQSRMAQAWKSFTWLAGWQLYQLHYSRHFLLLAASSGSNTRAALIPFTHSII